MCEALEDGQRPAQHHLGIVGATGGQQGGAEIAERLGHVGVVGAEDPSLDHERALVERDRLGVVAAPLDHSGELVDRGRDLVVVAPENALEDRQNIAQRQLGLAMPTPRVQNRGQRDAVSRHLEPVGAELGLLGHPRILQRAGREPVKRRPARRLYPASTESLPARATVLPVTNLRRNAMTSRAHSAVAVGVTTLAALGAAILAVALPVGATPPGTNGKLVFERPTRDGLDLFTVQADGSGLTRLARFRGQAGDSSWSPDGSKLAITRARNPEEGPYEIWVVNADGSGLKRLTRHRDFSISPAWSPDGGKIVYATNARGRDHLGLYVMNSDGSGARRLLTTRTRDYGDPTWSDDGSTIAFASGQSGESPRSFDSRIAVVDADDGGNLRHLTPRGGADELNPNWSPDGTAIAFERNRLFDVRQSDIWLTNADGSGERQVTATKFYETNPTFSPDGTRIAFTGDRDNRRLSKERRGRGFELYTMALDGSDVVRLTDNRRPDLFPDWQPLP